MAEQVNAQTPEAGYGLPILYFAIHGGAMLAERRLSLERRPRLARAWTTAWLVLPLPILFHPPFLRGVVWPLVGLCE
jgi:alginate O-acetyltransferase complex protein AlgI